MNALVPDCITKLLYMLTNAAGLNSAQEQTGSCRVKQHKCPNKSKTSKKKPLLISFVFNIQISFGHKYLFVKNSFVWV